MAKQSEPMYTGVYNGPTYDGSTTFQGKTVAQAKAEAEAKAKAQAQAQASAGTAPTSTMPNYVYSAPTYTPSRGSLKSAAELAALYGDITYDEAAIRAKFDAATNAEYGMLRKEYDVTSNKYYNQMYAAQNTAMDTIRRSNASAVATGASRGIQAAQELSAILGLEDVTNESATQLAQDRNLLMDKEAAAYTKNVVDALNTSNTVKQALGALGANIYASDTQFDVGEMQYYAALNQAAAALEGSKYTADSNLTGTKYASDKNLESTVYNADSNIKASGIAAEATKSAANTSAQASIKAAGISNAAQKAYYDNLAKSGGGTNQPDYIASLDALDTKFKAAMTDKNYNAAAMWYMQWTGTNDFNAALKIVKGMGAEGVINLPAAGPGKTPTPGQIPSWPDIMNAGTTKTPTQAEIDFFNAYNKNLPGTTLPKLFP